MRIRLTSIVLLAFASSLAQAAPIGLSLSGQSVNWSSPNVTSPSFVFSVLNTNGGVTDPVIGFSLGLAVLGETGSVGTVQFASATVPSNYLFSLDPNGSVGISTQTAFPSATIPTITDLANDNGIAVPSTGANLLSVTFTATSNASGVFDVFAVPYDGVSNGSYWTDGNEGGSGYPPHDFLNVPQGGGNVLLGTLTIPPPATPEPGSILLLGTGILIVVGHALRRRRGRTFRPADV